MKFKNDLKLVVSDTFHDKFKLGLEVEADIWIGHDSWTDLQTLDIPGMTFGTGNSKQKTKQV